VAAKKKVDVYIGHCDRCGRSLFQTVKACKYKMIPCKCGALITQLIESKVEVNK
jgi:hypothetical protein